jgi:hypothetical protein
MSALAAAYAQTFRGVAPQPGLQIDRGAQQLLGSLPIQTATLMAPLANTGLGAQAQLIGQKLSNAQRTLEQNTEIAFLEKQRKDTRKATLADRLLQAASGLGKSGASDWAMGQLLASQGDGMTRAGNRLGTALATFEGAGAANNPAIKAYLDGLNRSGSAGAGLPVPTA